MQSSSTTTASNPKSTHKKIQEVPTNTTTEILVPLFSDFDTISTSAYQGTTNSSSSSSSSSFSDLQQQSKEYKKLTTFKPNMSERKKAYNEPLSLENIIIKSTLSDKNQTKQAKNVVAAFNHGIPADNRYLIPAGARFGFRIPPDEFVIAHMNNVPELAMTSANGERVVEKITGPYTAGGIIEKVKQTAPFFGISGVWVLNVPQGQYAKAWSGLQPQLYGEGVHVIHDSNFKFDPTRDFVNASEPFISHGTTHILRVSPGQIARLTINNKPVILEYREEPYIFNTPLFTFDPRSDFLPKTTPHIQNGTMNIIRVLAGDIAKVWFDTESQLLDYKKEPYIFNDPLFRFEKVSQTQLFEKADAKLIVHGAIKRIIPPINEVAITNQDGKLVIINKSTIITSPTHTVVGFLNIGLQTLEFPSTAAREKKQREDKTASPDQINFETYKTSDGLGVGVKLLVSYKISDPEKALTQLTNLEGINTHIEGLTTTDMGQVIQQLTSSNFLTSHETKLNSRIEENKTSNNNSSPQPSAPLAESYADKAKKKLAADLKEYGIELNRLNVQEFKILDKNIESKMSEQALSTTQAITEQNISDMQFYIKRNKAMQEAEVLSIITKQNNANTLSEAHTELEAAKLRANARKIEADMELDILKKRGEVFQNYPQLLEYHKFSLLATAGITVTPQQCAMLLNNPGINFKETSVSARRRSEEKRNLDNSPTGKVSQLGFLSNSSSSSTSTSSISLTPTTSTIRNSLSSV